MLASLGIILLVITLLNIHIVKKLKLDDNYSKKNSKDGNSGIRGMLNALSLSLYYDPRAIFGHNQDSIVCVVIKNTKK
jgi:hypothetical protein